MFIEPGMTRGDARRTHKGFYGAWLYKEKSESAMMKFLESRVRRFFQIDFDRGILSYSVETAVRQIIPFRDILGAERSEEAAWSKSPATAPSGLKRSLSSVFSSKEPSFCFVLSMKNRKMTLSTHSEQDATAWVAALNKANELGKIELGKMESGTQHQNLEAAVTYKEQSGGVVWTSPKSPSLASESTAPSDDNEAQPERGFRALAAKTVQHEGHSEPRSSFTSQSSESEAEEQPRPPPHDEAPARVSDATGEEVDHAVAAQEEACSDEVVLEVGLLQRRGGVEHHDELEDDEAASAALPGPVAADGNACKPAVSLDASLDARDFGFDDDLMEMQSQSSSVAASPLPSPRSLACTSESTAVEQSEQKSPMAKTTGDVAATIGFAEEIVPAGLAGEPAAKTAAKAAWQPSDLAENESEEEGVGRIGSSEARIAADLELLARASASKAPRRKKTSSEGDQAEAPPQAIALHLDGGAPCEGGYNTTAAEALAKKEAKKKRKQEREEKKARAKSAEAEAEVSTELALHAEELPSEEHLLDEQERQARVAADLRLLRHMRGAGGPPVSHHALPKN